MTDSKESEEHSEPAPERITTEALRRRFDNAILRFAIPLNEEQLTAPLIEAMARVGKPFTEIGAALRASNAGMLSTISVPFILASQSATDKHWHRICLKARFTAATFVALHNESEKELALRRESEALASARSEWSSYVLSAQGTNAIAWDALAFLENVGSDEAVIGAANELILQGVVLCWGAFEVFVRDCFIAHLNAMPHRTLVLLADPLAKRRFELSKVSLEALATHNFNLSDRMGTLLAQQQDLSDLYSLKCVYQALFPDSKKLSDALSDSDLRLLSLRRNLIVHQCGVIDEKYAASANCFQPVGERLKFSPGQLEVHLRTTTNVAISILDAVSAFAGTS